MRKFVIAVMLAASLAWPGFSFATTPTDYQALAAWAGCTATVNTDTQVSLGSSFYSPATHEIWLGTLEDRTNPDLVFMVALHETAHCLQHQAGLLQIDPYDPVSSIRALELDADRQAADLACTYHRPGRALLHDLFVWAYETFGYDGDWLHGTLAERISQGDVATRCDTRLPESA